MPLWVKVILSHGMHAIVDVLINISLESHQEMWLLKSLSYDAHRSILCQKLLDFCATFRYFASVQRSLRFETSALSATELIAALGKFMETICWIVVSN